jgi:ESF2/ABP1 family protein
MRAEISKTTRENKEFVRNVEKSKMLDGMEAKETVKQKRKKTTTTDEDGAPGGSATAFADSGLVKDRKRTFKQIPLARKRGREQDAAEQPDQVKRVLSKIF